MMDKSWAFFNPFTEDYRTGLAKFISNSLEVASHEGNIKCLCAKCLNRFWLSNKEVEAHLIVEGMDRSYLQGSWVWHGETFGDPLPSSEVAQQLAAVNTPHSELGPLFEDIFSGPSVMGGMPINNHSEQEAPIPAYAPKVQYKLIFSFSNIYSQMVILYRRSGLDVCPTCGVSRYTTEVDDTAPSSKKRIPRNVLTYFPITPRL
ncbi:hypothetical protein ACFX16_007302 [Malus domestica]